MVLLRLSQPRGGIVNKLPLSIKYSIGFASQAASGNQSPTPSLLVWLSNNPGGTASIDRRRGEDTTSIPFRKFGFVTKRNFVATEQRH
ncbi:hypothetical protein ElyMa_001604700 [Elysia marginata]|uniref:Uncharacterized protein n=1 Tax=Elysia marginata TaxID=1093978 RepID=A0AAV4JJ49_9GAST|nr:hypothetical protein ElyMa_001604700 [Elysia marginata]